METVYLNWNKTSEGLPKKLDSCLCTRKETNIGIFYLTENGDWKEDGWDSKDKRIFTDITHWIYLKDIGLPKK